MFMSIFNNFSITQKRIMTLGTSNIVGSTLQGVRSNLVTVHWGSLLVQFDSLLRIFSSNYVCPVALLIM